MTGYPMFKRHDEVDANASPEERAAAALKPAVVDITMHLQEGEQFFVNRITFTGNTVTRDRVIRREIRLVENGVFNTEALKYSVKRLNQLGYFKPLEGNEAIQVQRRRARRTKSTSRSSWRNRTAISCSSARAIRSWTARS